MELVIVLVIALIVFGPRRLPQLGRSLGHGIRELRSALGSVGEQILDEPAELEELADAESSGRRRIVGRQRLK